MPTEESAQAEVQRRWKGSTIMEHDGGWLVILPAHGWPEQGDTEEEAWENALTVLNRVDAAADEPECPDPSAQVILEAIRENTAAIEETNRLLRFGNICKRGMK